MHRARILRADIAEAGKVRFCVFGEILFQSFGIVDLLIPFDASDQLVSGILRCSVVRGKRPTGAFSDPSNLGHLRSIMASMN